MEHIRLSVGSWDIDFLVSGEAYDIDYVLRCLYEAEAPASVIDQAEYLMLSCDYDCGFTFSDRKEYSYINDKKHRAVVLIGPTSSGEEFLDTFVHEIHHLAVAIASGLGVGLEGETPAYIAGDSVRELADVLCEFGCSRCNRK